MGGIRVTYSGLVAFAVAMVSIVTGTIFVVMVTRQLEPEEFGVWTIIGTMIHYVVATSPIISYWTVRQVARGEPVGRTAFVSGGLFAAGSVPAYILMMTAYSGIAPEYHSSMILSTVLVPVLLVSGVLMSVNMGYQPHKTSYGILILETVKIPLGVALVYVMNLGLDGVIGAVAGAQLCQVAVQIYFARDRLAGRFDPRALLRWIRLSWIPMYGAMPHAIWSAGIVAVPLVTGSITVVAYFAAAQVIAEIPTHAARVSQAVYPNLLASERRDYIADNLARQAYFLFPLACAAIVFAEPALFILNPAYQGLYLVVAFLTVSKIALSLGGTAGSILTGIEKADVENSPRFGSLIRSRLFSVPTVLAVGNAAYVAAIVAALPLLGDVSEAVLAAVWSLLLAAVSVPTAAYLCILARRSVEIRMPWRRVLTYAAAALAFAGAYAATSGYIITYSDIIYEHVWQSLLQFLLCSGVYLGVTYAADAETRKLVGRVAAEIRGASGRRP